MTKFQTTCSPILRSPLQPELRKRSLTHSSASQQILGSLMREVITYSGLVNACSKRQDLF